MFYSQGTESVFDRTSQGEPQGQDEPINRAPGPVGGQRKIEKPALTQVRTNPRVTTKSEADG